MTEGGGSVRKLVCKRLLELSIISNEHPNILHMMLQPEAGIFFFCAGVAAVLPDRENPPRRISLSGVKLGRFDNGVHNRSLRAADNKEQDDERLIGTARNDCK